MESELIQKIKAEFKKEQTNIMVSMWNTENGSGGYLIRQDGEVFAIGDNGLQELNYDTYGNTNELTEVELQNIYNTLYNGEDYIQDLIDAPMIFSYNDIKKLIKWAKIVPP